MGDRKLAPYMVERVVDIRKLGAESRMWRADHQGLYKRWRNNYCGDNFYTGLTEPFKTDPTPQEFVDLVPPPKYRRR